MASFTSPPTLILHVLALFSLLLSISSTPTGTTIRLPLTPNYHRHLPRPSNRIEHIKLLASHSLARAHHLKNPTTTTKIPVFGSELYAAHSMKLNFGTPPQTVDFNLDTGSSLVWFPCTSHYNCTNCNVTGIDPKKILKFLPKKSSTAKTVRCKDRICRLFYGLKTTPCKYQSAKCPLYNLPYGLGSTSGHLVTETLRLSDKKFPDLFVGCSTSSYRQMEGIAGFGRTPESLPSQLKAKKFSYCLVSTDYFDTNVTSDLVLYTASNNRNVAVEDGTEQNNLSQTRIYKKRINHNPRLRTTNWIGQDKNNLSPSDSSGTLRQIQYTPLIENPSNKSSAYRVYYYVWMEKIVIGGRVLKIPNKYLVPGMDGNGGTIVDSGTTYTVMDKPVYDIVVNEFKRQMIEKNYSLAPKKVERLFGLSPCFTVPDPNNPYFPGLEVHFKGGAKMVLDIENYVVPDVIDKRTYGCLGVSSSSAFTIDVGPSIIFGNLQQQNFHLEFDLEKNRFGFKRQNCA